jgi:membrane fusion protein (multidrug efflux system)
MKNITRIVVAVLGLLIVVGAIGAVKGLQIGRMVAHGEAFSPPPQVVTTAKVNATTWESTLNAVGSLTAVQGVTVTAELSGRVDRIAFEPGARVAAGQLLLQQDVSVETAQLRAAESDKALALKNLERARSLVKQNVMPQADFDARKSRYEQAAAQVDLIRATIAKKTIRAPFEGRLGIRRVNLGEVLEGGQPIVSLQRLDPIFVDFQLPQQEVGRLATGLKVRVTIESLGDLTIEGEVSAVNPEVDSRSRNITVQATLENPDERLRPGMFTAVELILPDRKEVLTIPATAVAYAPYSDSVFLVEAAEEAAPESAAPESAAPESATPKSAASESAAPDTESGEIQTAAGEKAGEKQDRAKVLRQQFIRLGEQRGDFVVVQEGLEAGQTVVSTGVFKVHNGQRVTIDNRLAPDFKIAPQPEDA